MRQKLAKVCQSLERPLNYKEHRAYIAMGYINSLTGCFEVPKGEDGIRMVYDATKSKLNDAMWAPNFMVPFYLGLAISISEKCFSTIFGITAGVDVTGLADLLRDSPLEDHKRLLMRWEQSLMGLKSSPYNCTPAFGWSEDFIRGDRMDPSNPFMWDKVVMNLPGQSGYNPSLPWVFRFDSINQKVAAFLCTYVD